MTQDEIKALIEDLRLNHEYCPKEVILQAADELERMHVRIPRPPKREWVGLTDEEMRDAVLDSKIGTRYKMDIPTRCKVMEVTPVWSHISHFAELIEAKLKEKNA
jgi:hypothetical protein